MLLDRIYLRVMRELCYVLLREICNLARYSYRGKVYEFSAGNRSGAQATLTWDADEHRATGPLGGHAGLRWVRCFVIIDAGRGLVVADRGQHSGTVSAHRGPDRSGALRALRYGR